SVVTNVYTTTGIVILGALGTKIDVGYYTSAQKLIDVTRSIVLMPITQIIFPLLSEKFGKNQKDGILAVRKLMPTFILISVAVLISINLFRDVIVRVIFGEQFMAVIPLITILSFGLFAVFYGVIIGGQVMLNLGLDRAFLNIQIIISVISLIVNAIAIPKGGAIVTASVWSISEVIISLYQIIYLKRLGITVITWKMLSITEIIGSIKYVFKKDN
ncbi:oligosaccharide flippase family protein, partial [Klebsiella variicola]|uniref:oligosaccharide flippase family protein n=2 Tax=Klebsiella TaxID=570 RepID=UPI0022313410